MGVSVRFGRKASGHRALMLVGSAVLLDDLSDKIRRGRCIGVVHLSIFLSPPFRDRELLQITPRDDICVTPDIYTSVTSVVFIIFPAGVPPFLFPAKTQMLRTECSVLY
jgi:hypothetical protein